LEEDGKVKEKNQNVLESYESFFRVLKCNERRKVYRYLLRNTRLSFPKCFSSLIFCCCLCVLSWSL